MRRSQAGRTALAVMTMSMRLTDAEAEEVASYLELVGGSEAALLKEAALRGLREIRLARGVLASIEEAPVEEV